MRSWKHLEGQFVGGKFRLARYLGGSDHGAVFLTARPQGEPGKAAIKLIAAHNAARQLSRWSEAGKMSHPHLVRVFEMGRCLLGQQEEFLYLLMEYADEDLSQVVPTRALTPQECQEMLPPVLDALAYLHARGFVHGHIKPANIMGVQERVKISADGLCLAGEPGSALGPPSVYYPPETAKEGLSPAGDVWSLGMTLAEVLTRKVPVVEAGGMKPPLPASVPAPLADVVHHCLCLDPKQRWTVSEIAARLAPASPPQQGVEPRPKQDRSRKLYLAPAIALGAILAILTIGWVYSRPRHSAESAAPMQTRASADEGASPVRQAPAPAAEPASTPAPRPAPVAKTPAQGPQHGAVVREVLPKVPKSARDTIQGTIRVRIRVALDEAGNVTGARFDSAGPSKYFARLAMEAAQAWKFASLEPQGPNPARNWLLRFEFRRDSTHVIPTPLSR
ncbi:MAG TPA: TonB family protein [Terriglobales bacterium]|nr:TonB family protein [Terriglobales bacterium]